MPGWLPSQLRERMTSFEQASAAATALLRVRVRTFMQWWSVNTSTRGLYLTTILSAPFSATLYFHLTALWLQILFTQLHVFDNFSY